MWVRFRSVSFAYDSATTPLLEGLDADFPRGWTGIVGANGAGKTTFLRLATGDLLPTRGDVHLPGNAIHCAQRTDAPPEELGELLDSTDAEACEIRGRLGLRREWLEGWDSASHGERKRAQIAVALWKRPEVLAIDEPTNHIDAEASSLLLSALRLFRGVGLLVSHDRELLDALCEQCLFLDPPTAVLRPGAYSAGSSQSAIDQESTRRDAEVARREARELAREAERRRREAQGADRMRSKRGLDPKDHDARARINLARVSGKDGAAGRRLRQIQGRIAQAQERADGIRTKKTCDLGIWVEGARSQRARLVRCEEVSIPLDPVSARCLSVPELIVVPDDRIALTGPNGSGKSTLVRHLMSRLALPAERVVYLPQEIDLESSRRIVEEVRRLPREELGRVMTVVSCLGSRPERLLSSDAPSPGEVRKVLLGLGIAREPHFLVLDEPTNHLDLPSIECLEEALEGCPCALLLVSHDRRFLGRLARIEWRIQRSPRGGNSDLTVVRMGDGGVRPFGRTPP